MVGDRESNAALWDDVLHHLSGLGNTPHIVGADRNFSLGRLRDVPLAMLAHLLTCRLVDVDLEYAGSQERCLCGYTRGQEVAAMHIDGVLTDPHTASTVLRVECIPSEGILGHRPVRFNLAVEAASPEVVRVIRPPQIVLPEREPDLQYALGKALLSPYQGKWDSLLAPWRSDALWEFWTWAAEESLLALSQEALTDPGQVDRASPLPRAPVGLQRGWGTWRLLKCVNLCPRQRHVSGAPATVPLARLQAALGALWTVIQGSRDAPGGAKVLSVGEERRWQALRKTLDGVRELQPPGPPGWGEGPPRGLQLPPLPGKEVFFSFWPGSGLTLIWESCRGHYLRAPGSKSQGMFTPKASITRPDNLARPERSHAEEGKVPTHTHTHTHTSPPL